MCTNDTIQQRNKIIINGQPQNFNRFSDFRGFVANTMEVTDYCFSYLAPTGLNVDEFIFNNKTKIDIKGAHGTTRTVSLLSLNLVNCKIKNLIIKTSIDGIDLTTCEEFNSIVVQNKIDNFVTHNKNLAKLEGAHNINNFIIWY